MFAPPGMPALGSQIHLHCAPSPAMLCAKVADYFFCTQLVLLVLLQVRQRSYFRCRVATWRQLHRVS